MVFIQFRGNKEAYLYMKDNSNFFYCLYGQQLYEFKPTGDILGRGAFGKVSRYRAQDGDEVFYLAVKTFDKNKDYLEEKNALRASSKCVRSLFVVMSACSR